MSHPSVNIGQMGRSKKTQKPLAIVTDGQWLTMGAALILVLVIGLILIFMALEALPLLMRVNVLTYLLGDTWLPVSNPPVFQILPFIVASLYITLFAMLIALPFGLAGAVYIAEMSHARVRSVAKSVFEVLAGVPSVIYGLIGLMILAPAVQRVVGLNSGLCGLTASLLLAVLVLPTIVSLSDEAIRAVPRDYRDASLALGANQWQTLWYVTVPAAASGIKSSLLLACGRALGETMLVLMVAGGRVSVPRSILSPMRTMTATLAAEINNTAFHSDHYRALFGIGFVLMLATLGLSTLAERYAERSRKMSGMARGAGIAHRGGNQGAQ